MLDLCRICKQTVRENRSAHLRAHGIDSRRKGAVQEYFLDSRDVTVQCPECGSESLMFGSRGYLCRGCSQEFRKDLGNYKDPVARDKDGHPIAELPQTGGAA